MGSVETEGAKETLRGKEGMELREVKPLFQAQHFCFFLFDTLEYCMRLEKASVASKKKLKTIVLDLLFQNSRHVYFFDHLHLSLHLNRKH